MGTLYYKHQVSYQEMMIVDFSADISINRAINMVLGILPEASFKQVLTEPKNIYDLYDRYVIEFDCPFFNDRVEIKINYVRKSKDGTLFCLVKEIEYLDQNGMDYFSGLEGKND